VAQRKAITRIGPQKTSFADSVFSKDLGGYNWQYQVNTQNFVRRPGVVSLGLTIDERALYGIGSIAVNANDLHGTLLARNGLRGLGVFSRPVFTYQPTAGGSPQKEVTSGMGASSASLDLAASTTRYELVAIGAYAWVVFPLRFAHVLQDCVLTVQDVSGVKTVSITAPGFSASVAATLSTASLVAAASSYLSALDSWGSQGITLSGLPYGEYNIRTNDVLEVNQVFSAPTTGAFVNSAYSHSTATVPSVFSGTTTPTTTVQIGDFLYFAGADMPLLRYDGCRLHAAGASPLDKSRNTAGATLTAPSGAIGAAGNPNGTLSYKILHRVYGPNGTYVDGPAYDLGSKSPVNQQVVWTINSVWTYHNMIAKAGPVNTVAGDGHAQSLACMYKYNRFVHVASGIVGADESGYTRFWNDFRVADNGQQRQAVFRPGDPVTYNTGGVGNRDYALVTYPNGTFCTSRETSPASSASSVSAGDVFVLLRTVNGGTVYYELAEFPTGAPSYTDNTSDATLVSSRPQYLDTAYVRLPPPATTVAVCAHQTRIVVAHAPSSSVLEQAFVAVEQTPQAAATLLSWSEPGTEHFPPENSVDLYGVCDKITGLASLDDMLYALTDRGVFYVVGTLIDPTTFTQNRISGSVSCASPAAVVVASGQVRFLSSIGELVVVEGNTVQVRRQLFPADAGLDFSQARAAHNAVEQRSYFFVPKKATYKHGWQPDAQQARRDVTSSSATDIPQAEADGLCLVVDDILGGYYLYKCPFAAGGAAVFNGATVFATNDSDGVSTLRQFDDRAQSDSGAAIPVKLQAPFEDAGSPHLHKTFPRLTVFDGDNKSEMSLTVKVEKDWDEGRIVQEFPLTFRVGEGYANQPYATDPYGDGVIPDKDIPLGNIKAKSLRVTIEHENAAENPVINGWVLEYSDTSREGREE
jgi:hypothetical protein